MRNTWSTPGSKMITLSNNDLNILNNDWNTLKASSTQLLCDSFLQDNDPSPTPLFFCLFLAARNPQSINPDLTAKSDKHLTTRVIWLTCHFAQKTREHIWISLHFFIFARIHYCFIIQGRRIILEIEPSVVHLHEILDSFGTWYYIGFLMNSWFWKIAEIELSKWPYSMVYNIQFHFIEF